MAARWRDIVKKHTWRDRAKDEWITVLRGVQGTTAGESCDFHSSSSEVESLSDSRSSSVSDTTESASSSSLGDDGGGGGRGRGGSSVGGSGNGGRGGSASEGWPSLLDSLNSAIEAGEPLPGETAAIEAVVTGRPDEVKAAVAAAIGAESKSGGSKWKLLRESQQSGSPAWVALAADSWKSVLAGVHGADGYDSDAIGSFGDSDSSSSESSAAYSYSGSAFGSDFGSDSGGGVGGSGGGGGGSLGRGGQSPREKSGRGRDWADIMVAFEAEVGTSPHSSDNEGENTVLTSWNSLVSLNNDRNDRVGDDDHNNTPASGNSNGNGNAAASNRGTASTDEADGVNNTVDSNSINLGAGDAARASESTSSSQQSSSSTSSSSSDSGSGSGNGGNWDTLLGERGSRSGSGSDSGSVSSVATSDSGWGSTLNHHIADQIRKQHSFTNLPAAEAAETEVHVAELAEQTWNAVAAGAGIDPDSSKHDFFSDISEYSSDDGSDNDSDGSDESGRDDRAAYIDDSDGSSSLGSPSTRPSSAAASWKSIVAQMNLSFGPPGGVLNNVYASIIRDVAKNDPDGVWHDLLSMMQESVMSTPGAVGDVEGLFSDSSSTGSGDSSSGAADRRQWEEDSYSNYSSSGGGSGSSSESGWTDAIEYARRGDRGSRGRRGSYKGSSRGAPRRGSGRVAESSRRLDNTAASGLGDSGSYHHVQLDSNQLTTQLNGVAVKRGPHGYNGSVGRVSSRGARGANRLENTAASGVSDSGVYAGRHLDKDQLTTQLNGVAVERGPRGYNSRRARGANRLENTAASGVSSSGAYAGRPLDSDQLATQLIGVAVERGPRGYNSSSAGGGGSPLDSYSYRRRAGGAGARGSRRLNNTAVSGLTASQTSLGSGTDSPLSATREEEMNYSIEAVEDLRGQVEELRRVLGVHEALLEQLSPGSTASARGGGAGVGSVTDSNYGELTRGVQHGLLGGGTEPNSPSGGFDGEGSGRGDGGGGGGSGSGGGGGGGRGARDAGGVDAAPVAGVGSCRNAGGSGGVARPSAVTAQLEARILECERRLEAHATARVSLEAVLRRAGSPGPDEPVELSAYLAELEDLVEREAAAHDAIRSDVLSLVSRSPHHSGSYNSGVGAGVSGSPVRSYSPPSSTLSRPSPYATGSSPMRREMLSGGGGGGGGSRIQTTPGRDYSASQRTASTTPRSQPPPRRRYAYTPGTPRLPRAGTLDAVHSRTSQRLQRKLNELHAAASARRMRAELDHATVMRDELSNPPRVTDPLYLPSPSPARSPMLSALSPMAASRRSGFGAGAGAGGPGASGRSFDYGGPTASPVPYYAGHRDSSGNYSHGAPLYAPSSSSAASPARPQASSTSSARGGGGPGGGGGSVLRSSPPLQRSRDQLADAARSREVLDRLVARFG